MKIKNKKLRALILKMVIEDQKWRNLAIKDRTNKKLIRKVYDCDTGNIKEARKIINQYGWPTFGLVGKKASSEFWFLIQHADRDLKFQKKCLKLLESAVNKNEANPKNFAYLTDRILSAEGKKQKFGTQYIIKDKKLFLKPVMNRKGLEKLRKEYNLSTIAEQDKVMLKEYKPFFK